MNFSSMQEFLLIIGQWSVILHSVMVFVLPLFMLGFITRFFGEKRSWKDGFGAWKFSLFASTSYFIPSFIFAWFVGPEFPALIGGLVGLGVVVIGAQKGFCLPQDTWTFGDSAKWDPEWTGTITGGKSTISFKISKA